MSENINEKMEDKLIRDLTPSDLDTHLERKKGPSLCRVSDQPVYGPDAPEPRKPGVQSARLYSDRENPNVRQPEPPKKE